MTPLNTQKMLLALTMALVGTLIALSPAHAAAAQCASRAKMVQQLNDRYGESAQSIGLTPSGQTLELFAHPETGTWTILLSFPNGTSCMMAAGTDYQYLNKPAGSKV